MEILTSVISHNSKPLDQFAAVFLDVFLGFSPRPSAVPVTAGCGSAVESSAALPSAWGDQSSARPVLHRICCLSFLSSLTSAGVSLCKNLGKTSNAHKVVTQLYTCVGQNPSNDPWEASSTLPPQAQLLIVKTA